MAAPSPKAIFLLPFKWFRDEQYFQPKVMLQAKGIMSDTAAWSDPEEIPGTRGGKARIDTLFDAVNSDNYEALILVGGKGSREYYGHEVVLNLVREFNRKHKVVGAIGLATGILANAHIISRKKVVSPESIKPLMEEQQAEWVDQAVVSEGNIVTARNLEAAMEFGQVLAQLLLSPDKG